jgi:glycerophosphoryl diester phosphodiesterase
LPVNFLSLNERLVRGDLVRRAHQRGLEVHVWTVIDRESALRLLDLGCDNLITSDPAPMRELVDWYAGLDDTQRMLLRLRRWMRE